MRYLIFILFFIGVFLTIVNYKNKKNYFFTIVGTTMGAIPYNVKYFHNQHINYKEKIDSILINFNNSLSTYIADSEISNLNKLDTLHNISNTLFTILKTSEKIYQKTYGAFDPTIGSLVNLWGFGPKEITIIPDTSIILNSLKNIGYNKIYFNNKIAVRSDPEIYLDFSSIAKGYAVDIVSDFLLQNDINNFMIEIGGEIRCNGKSENHDYWKIGIEEPVEGNNYNNLIAYVTLLNKSIATSGNYKNYYINKGLKIFHTIDPRTGFPASSNLLSATVFSDKCIEADAYATAFMVLGLKQSIDIIKKNDNIDALLIYTDEYGIIQKYISDNIMESVNLL